MDLKRLVAISLIFVIAFVMPSQAIVKINTPTLDTLLSHIDTPSSYSGSGGLCLKVNGGGSAVEFATCASGGSYPGDIFVNETGDIMSGQLTVNSSIVQRSSTSDGTLTLQDRGSDESAILWGNIADANANMEMGAFSSVNNIDTKGRVLKIFSTAKPNIIEINPTTGITNFKEDVLIKSDKDIQFGDSGQAIGRASAGELRYDTGIDHSWYTNNVFKMSLTSTKLTLNGIDMNFVDNQKATFGTSSDSEIFSNGNDLIINPNIFNAGSLLVNGTSRFTNNISIESNITLSNNSMFRIEGSGGATAGDFFLSYSPLVSQPIMGSEGGLRLMIDSDASSAFSTFQINHDDDDVGTNLFTVSETYGTGIGTGGESCSWSGFVRSNGNDLYVDDDLCVNGAAFYDGSISLTGAIDATSNVHAGTYMYVESDWAGGAGNPTGCLMMNNPERSAGTCGRTDELILIGDMDTITGGKINATSNFYVGKEAFGFFDSFSGGRKSLSADAYLPTEAGYTGSSTRGLVTYNAGSIKALSCFGDVGVSDIFSSYTLHIRKNGVNTGASLVLKPLNAADQSNSNSWNRGTYTFSQHDVLSLYVDETSGAGSWVWLECHVRFIYD